MNSVAKYMRMKCEQQNPDVARNGSDVFLFVLII